MPLPANTERLIPFGGAANNYLENLAGWDLTATEGIPTSAEIKAWAIAVLGLPDFRTAYE